jgi:hypothetical protein
LLAIIRKSKKKAKNAQEKKKGGLDPKAASNASGNRIKHTL